MLDATLGTIAAIEDRIETPAIVVLGPAGKFREQLDWYTGALRDQVIPQKDKSDTVGRGKEN